jgi:NAD(P)-dependent dehydrogenase (short-subunit alcohol dehydrogenase family)
MGEFHDSVIIVTGGGSGIGRATALLFASDGAIVTILDRDSTAGEQTLQLIEQSGGRGLFIQTDVASGTGVRSAVDQIVERLGRIDVLFANAAIQIVRPVDELTEQEWNDQLQINLGGTFLCCKEVIPVMRRQKRGCIVITTSGHAYQSYLGYSSYAATKGGTKARTEEGW